MKIQVSGLISPELNKQVKFWAREIGKDLNIKSKIFITISLYGADNGQINILGPEKYQIWLNKALNARNTLETLAHELKHVNQFESGNLVAKNGNLYFKGENMAEIPYMRRPFEIEARKYGKFALIKYQ